MEQIHPVHPEYLVKMAGALAVAAEVVILLAFLAVAEEVHMSKKLQL
jgi:hypothetical protein